MEPQPAVDVLDVLADAAHDAYFVDDQLSREGMERALWRQVAQAVRTAAEPYQNPTPEAYQAAVRALERQRQRADDESARSHQLAILAEDLLKKYEVALLGAHNNDVPEDDWDVDDYRRELAEALCAGGHAEDQPHVDFRSVG